MGEQLWFQGHLAWPLFCVIVFTALLGLVVDYCWRVVRMRSAYLALVSGALWLAGMGVILIISSR